MLPVSDEQKKRREVPFELVLWVCPEQDNCDQCGCIEPCNDVQTPVGGSNV